MNRSLICGLALTLAVPAVAGAKPKPDTAPTSCTPKRVGFAATGTYVSGTLTQTAGADTAARGDDRYSGDLTVLVAKANHKVITGEQTFTLADARVRFHPHTDSDLAAGDRVKLHGTVTRLRKKCDAAGFVPTVTVRKADIRAKRA